MLAAAVLLLAATPVYADDAPTPADQFKSLLRDYNRVSSSGAVLTDAERLQFVGQVYKQRHAMEVRFLELAEKYPQDPIALDALMQAVWQVNTIPWPVELVGEDRARARAFELLQRDHIRSEKLSSACERVSFGFAKEYETFLRTVLAHSPHKPVQAQACLGLAHFLTNRLRRLELIEDEPRLGREFAGLYGKEYLEALQRQDRARASKEAEDLFQRAVKDYGDVKIEGGGTIGGKGKSELYEFRHLSVGKVAPDIAGEDQDGFLFKLSDYRGKVVLLDFWHQQ